MTRVERPTGGVDTLKEQAELLIFEVHRYDEALERIEQAIAIQPGDAEIHCLRAAALRMSGRLEEALDAVEEAVHLDPEDSETHRVRAFLLLGLKRLEQAREAIGDAVSLDPEDETNHALAVQVELALGNPDQAWTAARRCLELAPDSETSHDAIAEAAYATEDWAQAERAFHEVLRREPENAHTLANLGLVRARRGDDEGALSWFTRALTADPELSIAFDEMVDAADGWLWGRRLTLPRTRAEILRMLIPGAQVLAVAYVAWFPARAVRAVLRWRRLPERTRQLVGDEERRWLLDAAASWAFAFGVAAIALWWIAPAVRWVAVVAAVLVVVALARLIPRVFGLDWPTRRQPEELASSTTYYRTW